MDYFELKSILCWHQKRGSSGLISSNPLGACLITTFHLLALWLYSIFACILFFHSVYHPFQFHRATYNTDCARPAPWLAHIQWSYFYILL